MGAGGKIVPHDSARRDDKMKPAEIRVFAHERRALVQGLLRFKPFGGSRIELFLRRDRARRGIFGGREVGGSIRYMLCQFRDMRPDLLDPNWTAPPCSRWMIGDRIQGDYTMASLGIQFRLSLGDRYIVDKTGLTGSYRLTLTFDRMAGLRGPDVAPAADAAPSVFTAVQEQLGLKLESSKALRETLVIDHVERPTELTYATSD